MAPDRGRRSWWCRRGQKDRLRRLQQAVLHTRGLSRFLLCEEERRREAVPIGLRQARRDADRPDREEAIQSLLPGHPRLHGRDHLLQLALPFLPEPRDQQGDGRLRGGRPILERVPELAAENECEGVGFSYNEPTIFIEYVIDAAREAHRMGKYTVFVTNGYGTVESVRAMRGYVDAVVVDYKGSGEEIFQRRQTMTVSAEPIKETLLELKAQKIHTELTDLIIPQVGEDLEEAKRLCRWLYDNLGPDVPIQFTRFHPDYKLLDLPPTPNDLLVRHHAIAKEAGLNYAYIGNVPGSPQGHTYCPGCGAVAIERYGFMITGWNLDADYRCAACGYKIPIEGKRASRFRYSGIESFHIPHP